MPRTKLDPVEIKKLIVRRKLAFIALIAALVGVTNIVMMVRSDDTASAPSPQPPRQVETSTTAETLGESTQESTQAQQDFVREATDTIQTTATAVEKTTQEIIDETKEKVDQSFNELIYTTTIKPIIDKVHSLPPEQQQNIQEALCKPE